MLAQENNDKVEALYLPVPLCCADLIEDTLSNSVVWKIICKGADLELLGNRAFPCDVDLPWKLHLSSFRVVDLRNEGKISFLALE